MAGHVRSRHSGPCFPGHDLGRGRGQHRVGRPKARTCGRCTGGRSNVRYRSPSDLVVGDDVEVVGTVGRMSNVPTVHARSVLVVTWVLGALAFPGRRTAHPPGRPGLERPGRLLGPPSALQVGPVRVDRPALRGGVARRSGTGAVSLRPDLAVAIAAVSLPFTVGAVGLLGLGVALGPVPVATPPAGCSPGGPAP